MPFKEGVDEERVQWFRQLVATAKSLDAQVDTGALTPDDAFQELDKAMDSMASKTPAPKKAEKAEPEAVGHKAAR